MKTDAEIRTRLVREIAGTGMGDYTTKTAGGRKRKYPLRQNILAALVRLDRPVTLIELANELKQPPEMYPSMRRTVRQMAIKGEIITSRGSTLTIALPDEALPVSPSTLIKKRLLSAPGSTSYGELVQSLQTEIRVDPDRLRDEIYTICRRLEDKGHLSITRGERWEMVEVRVTALGRVKAHLFT